MFYCVFLLVEMVEVIGENVERRFESNSTKKKWGKIN